MNKICPEAFHQRKKGRQLKTWKRDGPGQFLFGSNGFAENSKCSPRAMDPLGQRNGKQSTIWNLLWGMFVAFLFAIFGRNIPSTWFETIVYLVVDIPSFFFGFFDFGVFSAFDLCQKMSENDFKRDVKRGKNLAFGNIPTIFWKSGLKMSDILSTSGWLYVYIVSAEKTVGSVFLEN